MAITAEELRAKILAAPVGSLRLSAEDAAALKASRARVQAGARGITHEEMLEKLADRSEQ